MFNTSLFFLRITVHLTESAFLSEDTGIEGSRCQKEQGEEGCSMEGEKVAVTAFGGSDSCKCRSKKPGKAGGARRGWGGSMAYRVSAVQLRSDLL